MHTRFYGVFMLLWLGLGVLQAQPCTLRITGRVLDAHDRTPLDFSTIYLVETGRGTLADSTGRYLMDGLCPGNYTLVCSHLGCEPVTLSCFLSRDTVVDFYPEHHVEVLAAVETTARRVSEAPAQTRTDIDGVALERLQGRSLAGMLQQVSGVRMVQTGPGIQKPMIHGLYGNRVLIVQNEVRQEGQQWGIDHAPEIDPAVAGSLTVIKGAEGVRYGPEAMGGVVLVTPRPLPRSPGLGGQIWTDLQSNGRGGKTAVRLEGGIGQSGWGWRTTASYRLLGDSRAAGYPLSNTGIRETGLSLQTGTTGNRGSFDLYYSYYAGAFGILRAAHIGNLSDLEAAIQASEPLIQNPFTYEQLNPRQRVAHHLVKVKGERRLNALWSLEGRYSFQADRRKEYDIRRGDRNNIPALDLTILSQQADLSLAHRPWKHLQGSAGLTGQYQTNFNDAETGVRPLIPNFITTTTSAFALERYVRDKVELEGGVRFDHRFLRVSRFDEQDQLVHPEYRWSNISGTVGGLYRPARGWETLLQLATAFRPPGANELFSDGLHHASAAIETGNDSLGVEHSYKAVLTVRHLQSSWGVEVSGFLNPIPGMILLQPTGELALTVRGAFPVFRYIQTDALLTGLDVDVHVGLAPWLTYFGQVSFLWSDDLHHVEPLFGMPPVRHRHELRLDHLPAWGGWTWTASAALTRVERQANALSTDYAPPPPAYMLVDASVETAKAPWRLTLASTNLTNAAYRDYLDRLRYFADGPGRNILLKLSYSFM